MKNNDDMIHVDPLATRDALVKAVRDIRAEAAKFPEGSHDRIFTEGVVRGVLLAVEKMMIDFAIEADRQTFPESIQ